MSLNLKDLKFQGLNEWETVDFSEVENIEQLKNKIICNYVVLCRKCASSSFCKFYDSKEPPCPILVKIVHNFIDMNIKSIDIQSRYDLIEFIKSTILITQIINHFENWKGMYVDEWYNSYFEGRHPRINSLYCYDLLADLSKFARAYRVVKTDRYKTFIILVEGDSEFEALPPIFNELGVGGIYFGGNNKVIFKNLRGKDTLQKEKIRLVLTRYREEDTDYFLILDNDVKVKEYIEDLKREKLIEDNHYLIWENKFEDNFSEEAILKALGEEVEWIKDKVDIKILKKRNSLKKDIGKSIEYILKEEKIDFNFDEYKVKISKRLAEQVCSEIKESVRVGGSSYDYLTLTPTSKNFPDFVEKLRKIKEEINRITSEYHVIKA